MAGAMSRISTLTSDQAAQLPLYRDKWEAIALSTRPIDIGRARGAIQSVYLLLDKAEPEIQFFDGPQDLAAYLRRLIVNHRSLNLGLPLQLLPLNLEMSAQLNQSITEEFGQMLQSELISPEVQQWQFQIQMQMMAQVSDLPLEHPDVFAPMVNEVIEQAWQEQQSQWRSQLRQQPGGDVLLKVGDSITQQVTNLGEQLGQQWERSLSPLWTQPWFQDLNREWQEIQRDFQQDWTAFSGAAIGLAGFGLGILNQSLQGSASSYLDFCVEVLDCPVNPRTWLTMRSLAKAGGFILPFEHTCLVVNRPVFISLDEEKRLHAEGEPALTFADGSSWYAFHGTFLPERYGRVPPQIWRSEWLLTEPNAELRRVLLQGIGYSRLCQELQAIELDHWREYTLLRIGLDVDVEPIYLLKMVCPSTGHIHATRVPPTMTSAREAIRWVNGGIDPDDFSVQS